MSGATRILATLALSALAVAYLTWRADVGETMAVIADASASWFALAVAIMTLSVLPMAVRWKWLLAAQRIPDRLGWLTRTYLVSYAVGQVLPTSLGGDAARIYDTARRHPGRTADVTAIVLLERALGGAATVLLGAAGFALALGRYDLGAYLWLEAAFVAGTVVLGLLFFARTARPLLASARAPLRRVRLERPVRGFYDGVHHFRGHVRLLVGVFAFTTAIQAVRILAIWACARSAGIELGPRVFYVMGPLFLLVQLVPFTLNGLAIREAFFVSFLGTVGVGAEPAFAAGILFFAVTLVLAVPGGVILLREGLRGGSRPRAGHA